MLRDDGDQPVRLRELRDVGRQLSPVPGLGQGLLLFVVQVELRLERYGERVSATRKPKHVHALERAKTRYGTQLTCKI